MVVDQCKSCGIVRILPKSEIEISEDEYMTIQDEFCGECIALSLSEYSYVDDKVYQFASLDYIVDEDLDYYENNA